MQKTINIRPADLILVWEFDPNKSFPHLEASHIKQSAGVIPDFFTMAIINGAGGDIQQASEMIDEAYGYGGFNRYPWPSKISDQNRLVSNFESDPELDPLLILKAIGDHDEGLEVILYSHDIVALRDSHGTTKISRFD
tara:strand:+ start:58 stop:471 length:414 start_codon:yes stop_codon:yes gene_type:complete